MTQLTMGITKWQQADAAFDRGLQAWLDWCRELAVLAENVDAHGQPLPRSHPDYTTQEEIADRYKKERVRITEAIAIGRDKRFVHIVYESLPKDKTVLYQLTQLDDKTFKDLAKPTTTRATLQRLSAPPVEAPRPKCPGVEGIGPGCWKWSEAWGSWEQQAPHVEPAPKRTNTPLTPENLAAHEERVKSNRAKQQATFDSFSNSLKSLLDQTQQHMPAAILDDASPIEYLTQAFATMLQYGGAPAAKLAKQMFSSAYHPDSGKVKHDASLMGSINKALSFLEK